MHKRALFLLFLLFFSLIIKAQEERRGVAIIASPKKDSILLRWAPNHHIVWKKANTKGYTLERFVLYRNGKKLSSPEKKVLLQNVKPKQDSWWEDILQDSLLQDYDWLCVGAQAIYGKEFEVVDPKQSPMMQIIQKTREQENRFSFALFAADQSPRVAKAMGLSYTDKEIKENEMYVYRVYATGLSTKIDTGYVYTGVADYRPLPKPIGLKARVDGNKAMLMWNQFLLSATYNAYMVERSEDGGNSYKPLNKKPSVLAYDEYGDVPMEMMKVDSLPDIKQEYLYRIYGITAFGEKGPYSRPLTVKGKLKYTIRFEDFKQEITADNKVQLIWKLDSLSKPFVKHFEILRSLRIDGEYDVINGNLSKSTFHYIDQEPMGTNYYKIKAIGINDDTYHSIPLLAQIKDSIPPAPPIHLKGQIDTTGLVYLSWDKNIEKDLAGYRVFRANYEEDEFSQITSEMTIANTYIDSISLYNLNSTIYYKVMAVDQRFNESTLSKALRLQKPDTIAPSPPFFTGYQIKKNGIELEWEHSFNEDVKSEKILKKRKGSVHVDTVASFPIKDSVQLFIDKDIKKGEAYFYAVVAQDRSGNQSQIRQWLEAEKADDGFRNQMKGVNVEAKSEMGYVLLSWGKMSKQVKEVHIYRSKQGESLAFYRQVANVREFKDKSVIINTHYQYRLQAIYKDGGKSPFTSILKVHY